MKLSWRRIARRIRVPLGFVFAAVFLWLARPTAASVAGSLVLVLPGLGLRAYASGYVKKNAELTTTGPYAYTRNPLYLGSMMIAFGFAGASRSWMITLLLVVLFALIYVPTIRSEEEFLQGQFPGFNTYARQVPRILPRLSPYAPGGTSSPSTGTFAPALYRKHREYNALIGASALYVALLVRLYHWH